jgi:hypothetical protein
MMRQELRESPSSEEFSFMGGAYAPLATMVCQRRPKI